MLRPVTAFFAMVVHHLDAIVLNWTKGRHTASEIVGFPIIELTTTGAKSGQLHTIPLVSLIDGENIAVIGSNFGRQHNPGWYYNLMANPKCVVRLMGRSGEYIAHQAQGKEREKYWQMGVSIYRGYEVYKARAAHRVIPVMVLEPLK